MEYGMELAYIAVAVILVYIIARLFSGRKKQDDFSSILDSPEYKVKSKYEF